MKKLFSYLLISSMVVLSSCTNYDDQFDDLNTQINSLKSQIEGFSSLSSGLTALQGTVASLQTAIANIPVTPATDISGLESTQAALKTALTALATQVTALQTSLATAATSTDVANLTAALDKVKADLADLLASNNVYTPAATGLVINSAASLEVAKSLGGKLSIINGSVNITNGTSNGLNAADLQAVLDKMVTITGTMTYTQNGTGSAPNFDALTSAGNLSIDNEHAISLAALSNVGTLTVSNDVKVTSFSAPKLATVAFASHTLDLPKATNIDLSALASYESAALTINGNNVTAGYTLSMPLFQDNAADGVVRAMTLTIGGHVKNLTLPAMKNKNSIIDADDAKVIVLAAFEGTLNSGSTSNHIDVTLGGTKNTYVGGPKLEKANITGKLTATSVTGNPAEGPTFTFDNANKLVSATIAGEANDVSFTGNTGVETVIVSANAVDVDFINATSLVSATVSGNVRGAVDFSGATSLETVVVSGASSSIDLNGNTSLTSVSLTGSTKTVEVIGATSLTTLDLAHTTAFPAGKTDGVAALAADKGAALHVMNNTELTSLKADKVTLVGDLRITNNPELTSISFDAITAAAATYLSATVYVGAEGNGAALTTASKGNKLTAQKKSSVAPVVVSGTVTKKSGTITTNSGMADLATFLTASAAKATHDIAVIFDKVDSYVDADGKEDLDNVYHASNSGAKTGVKLAEIVTVANSKNNSAGSTSSTNYKKAWSIDALDDDDDFTITAGGSSKNYDYDLATDKTVGGLLSRIAADSFWTNLPVTVTSGTTGNHTGYTVSGQTSTTVQSVLFGSTIHAASATSTVSGQVSLTINSGATSATTDIATAISAALSGTAINVWSSTSTVTPSLGVWSATSTVYFADAVGSTVRVFNSVNTAATGATPVYAPDWTNAATIKFTMGTATGSAAIGGAIALNQTIPYLAVQDDVRSDGAFTVTIGGSDTAKLKAIGDDTTTTQNANAIKNVQVSGMPKVGIAQDQELVGAANTSNGRGDATQTAASNINPVYNTTYWTWN